MWVLLLLLIITIILVVIRYTGIRNENYWKKRGVKFDGKHKVLGPLWKYVTQDRPMFEILTDLYNEYPNEPAVGIGSLFTKALYVRDPVNVHHVLQTDFHSFSHRGLDIADEDILGNNVLFMNGIKWKLTRQSMTPIFTSAKLKNMFYIIDKSAKDFITVLNNDPKLLKGDAYNTLTTFCNAAVGAAVFGITSGSTFDSPFLHMARQAFKVNFIANMKFAIMSTIPKLGTFLGIKLFAVGEEFFVGAIKQVLRQREKDQVKKHDFADVCVSLQKNGVLKDPETGFEMKVTDEMLAAQGFFFFIAGVEPCATTMFSTLYEIGKNKDIQKQVLEEVDEVFNKYPEGLTFEAMSEFQYLEKVLNEALRMYPPIGFLTRRCLRDTVLPVGNIKIEEGTKMFTSLYEIHHDPKYFPNPKVFDPERFATEESLKDINYMPFGKGNRICIGVRYAKLQVKAGLVHVLRHFSIKSEDKPGGLKFSKQAVQVRLENVDIQFIPRK